MEGQGNVAELGKQVERIVEIRVVLTNGRYGDVKKGEAASHEEYQESTHSQMKTP